MRQKHKRKLFARQKCPRFPFRSRQSRAINYAKLLTFGIEMDFLSVGRVWLVFFCVRLIRFAFALLLEWVEFLEFFLSLRAILRDEEGKRWKGKIFKNFFLILHSTLFMRSQKSLINKLFLYFLLGFCRNTFPDCFPLLLFCRVCG